MSFNDFAKKTVFIALLMAFLSTPSLALDSKTIRDISRADTFEKLGKLADDITKSAATRKPKDFEEGTQIASETNVYLLYIVTKQNKLMVDMHVEDNGE